MGISARKNNDDETRSKLRKKRESKIFTEFDEIVTRWNRWDYGLQIYDSREDNYNIQ